MITYCGQSLNVFNLTSHQLQKIQQNTENSFHVIINFIMKMQLEVINLQGHISELQWTTVGSVFPVYLDNFCRPQNALMLTDPKLPPPSSSSDSR